MDLVATRDSWKHRPTRLLVVEDDTDLGKQLQQGLWERGFAVDRADSAEAGWNRARTGVYDLLILDRMLPCADGLELMSWARQAGVTSAVIFLSGRGELDDRLDGLDAGADDYLVKPFSFPELVSRIHAVLRRNCGREASILRVDELLLDPIRHKVERSGRDIELTTREFRLLQFLMHQSPNVVSRDMILTDAWKMAVHGHSNVVDAHMKRLRDKIDRDFEQPLIHTLRGVGYVVRRS